LFPAEQERIVRLLIKKVVVTPHTVELQFRPNGLERLAAELKLPTVQASVDEVTA
jgi:site-specific DNA recombinase